MLELQQVSKSFGTHSVLRNISFSVPEHSIFGFIGQNGAGKTTTMKLILGLLPMDTGTITVNGATVSYGQNKTNQLIGYLPDVPEFYSYMNPMEYLSLCGKITGLNPTDTKKRASHLLSMVGLDQKKRKIGGFSRGMKQRLGIAQALLHRPKLLICDEPTSALDPMGRKDLLDILQSVSEQTTVLFSTHILSDVERICDRIAVLNQGEIVLSGTLSDIKKNYHHDTLEIEFQNVSDKNQYVSSEEFQQLKNKQSIELPETENPNLLLIKTPQVNQLMKQSFYICYQHDIFPQKTIVLSPTLENLFLQVVDHHP